MPLHSLTDQTVRLVRAASPWLSAGDPDPEGRRVKIMQRVLREQPYLKAAFWECVSSPPHHCSTPAFFC